MNGKDKRESSSLGAAESAMVEETCCQESRECTKSPDVEEGKEEKIRIVQKCKHASERARARTRRYIEIVI